MNFIETEIGPISRKWELVELNYVANVIDPHPSHRAPKAVENGFPFAGIGDIDEFGNIKGARIVSKEIIKEHIKNYKINSNSIGYGRVGTVGKVVKFKNRNKFQYALAPTLAVINPKDNIDANFLYAVIRSNMFLKQVLKYVTGSTRPSIGIQLLRKIKIIYPSIEEQRKIGKIINCLDKKIEINRKINENLEEQAKEIFKRWFIDYEFPNEEGQPYKSSGGEMIESELGLIPKGWEVKKFNQVIENFNSKRIPLSKQSRENLKKIYPYYGATSIIDYVNDYIFDGTYILMGEDGSVMDEKGFPILQYVWGKFWVNNHAHIFKAKECLTDEFIYLFLKNINVSHLVTGAVQPKISQKNINSLSILIPSNKYIIQFKNIVTTLFDYKKTILTSNSFLEKLRDTLLSKLMTGEIDVSEIDI